MVRRMAEELCGGRLLLTLEGGYNVAGITESVKETLFGLINSDAEGESGENIKENRRVLPITLSIVGKVKKVHSAFWPVFA